MPTIQISLPEPLREFVEAEVRSGKYSDASEYLSRLVQQDQQDWKEREKARLEEAVLAGLASGEPLEMTPAIWRQLKDEMQISRS